MAAAGLPLLLSAQLRRAAARPGPGRRSGTFFAQATATGFVGRAATTDRGSASGLYLASYFLGGLVGSAVLGQVFDRLGWTACVIGIGASLAAGGLLTVRLEIRLAAASLAGASLIAAGHRPDARNGISARAAVRHRWCNRSIAFTTTEIPMSNCVTQVCSAALLALSLMVSSAAPGVAEGLKPVVVRFRRHRHQERLRHG